MRTPYAMALLSCSLALTGSAQSYCSPTFANGCFDWHSIEIIAGSINWTPGADDCTVSDYTSLSTTVVAGSAISMHVTNGVWCGCAVWIDLDNSYSFEDGENLYYNYVGGSPSYQYDFGVTIPNGTPTGSYRMRIVSPWGSDGFQTSNGNGFGSCGSFQYGNYNDFTVNVNGSLGVEDAAHEVFTLSPNPTSAGITISGVGPLGRITVMDVQGRVVEQHQVQSDRSVIDASAWTSGVYMIRVSNAEGTRMERLVVQ
ncbi:MAG: T9SS type A sorting domain-containing protein [Flavobacteriales bacterium]|nr:T9SS type A sorting domain-containing protein [Flavobacteriales bacterium]